MVLYFIYHKSFFFFFQINFINLYSLFKLINFKINFKTLTFKLINLVMRNGLKEKINSTLTNKLIKLFYNLFYKQKLIQNKFFFLNWLKFCWFNQFLPYNSSSINVKFNFNQLYKDKLIYLSNFYNLIFFFFNKFYRYLPKFFYVFFKVNKFLRKYSKKKKLKFTKKFFYFSNKKRINLFFKTIIKETKNLSKKKFIDRLITIIRYYILKINKSFFVKYNSYIFVKFIKKHFKKFNKKLKLF